MTLGLVLCNQLIDIKNVQQKSNKIKSVMPFSMAIYAFDILLFLKPHALNLKNLHLKPELCTFD